MEKNAIVYNKHKEEEKKNSVFVCSSLTYEKEAMDIHNKTHKKKINEWK